MTQLLDTRHFVHRINAEGRIVFVNDHWLAFGEENSWATSREAILGTSLLRYVSDLETQHIYSLLIARARDWRAPVTFNYRCDSPDVRRFMVMRIDYDETSGLVEFRSRVLRLEPRPFVALLDATNAKRSQAILDVCGWCKSVRVGRKWLEVEQAVSDLGLFNQEYLPQVSHGICPSCSSVLESERLSQ